MKIVVADSMNLKTAIDSIASLVEEGVFEIGLEGLRLKAMDPSQISMISFFMPKESFLEYHVEEAKKIGLDIDQLSSVLSRGSHSEKAELGIEDARFVIKFIAEKKKRTFKIPILEIGEGVQKEPKIEYRSFVKITADAFREGLKDAKLVSSHIRLSLSAERFVAEVKGDSGDVVSEFEKDSPQIAQISSSVNARVTFPLQYLEDITKACQASEILTINLENERPLMLEYKITGAEVKYYLAPRIESE